MNVQPTKFIAAAKEVLKAGGYFVDNLWHVDDVHFICDQHGLPRIEDDEAHEVFNIANQQFDGENGISWPQLEKALRIYLHRKTTLASMCEAKLA